MAVYQVFEQQSNSAAIELPRNCSCKYKQINENRVHQIVLVVTIYVPHASDLFRNFTLTKIITLLYRSKDI